jgi:hypothetical protein
MRVSKFLDLENFSTSTLINLKVAKVQNAASSPAESFPLRYNKRGYNSLFKPFSWTQRGDINYFTVLMGIAQ